MSVKSKAKSVGVFLLKYVVTLGAGALIDRYVKGATGRVARELLDAVAGTNPKPSKLVQSLQGELDALLEAKVLPTFQKEMEAMRSDLEARLGLKAPLPVRTLPRRRK